MTFGAFVGLFVLIAWWHVAKWLPVILLVTQKGRGGKR